MAEAVYLIMRMPEVVSVTVFNTKVVIIEGNGTVTEISRDSIPLHQLEPR